MYDEASIPISPMPDIPEGCDPVSLHESAEFKSYQSGDEMPSIKIEFLTNMHANSVTPISLA